MRNNDYYSLRFQFKKDYKRAQKQTKDLSKLKEVVEKLAAQEQLDVKYRDHPLLGEWKGFRDCHIEPDCILIYKATKYELILARTGTHAELFK